MERTGKRSERPWPADESGSELAWSGKVGGDGALRSAAVTELKHECTTGGFWPWEGEA